MLMHSDGWGIRFCIDRDVQPMSADLSMKL